GTGKISTDKSVARVSFPKTFKLFTANLPLLKQELFKVVNNSVAHTHIISLPNADGAIEEFEIVEASNFDAELQAQFPEIRAFSGKGITDKYATLKMSYSPQGIQTMVFRTGKENEFIEPYSQDHSIYAVFKSQRSKTQLPWKCTTPGADLELSINTQVQNSGITGRSGGNLKT
ncbi:MAG TPA: peptidase, partial [Ferruginibacter sp.]|nr:peptidase [Ferruginibacter sp.]